MGFWIWQFRYPMLLGNPWTMSDGEPMGTRYNRPPLD